MANKPNLQFELTVRDIEVIEHALSAKAGRRGIQIASCNYSEELRNEMLEIQRLLGKLHEQKVWYRPKDETYVSG